MVADYGSGQLAVINLYLYALADKRRGQLRSLPQLACQNLSCLPPPANGQEIVLSTFLLHLTRSVFLNGLVQQSRIPSTGSSEKATVSRFKISLSGALPT